MNFRNGLFFIGICLLVAGACKSTSKMLQHGDYDSLINKSIKKITKGKASSEDIELLDRSYKLANLRDMERINLLKNENRPEVWEEVFSLYTRLDNRQKNVRKVLPLNLNGRTIDYEQIDYSSSIVDAKSKAAKYYYDNGQSMMNLRTKDGYRQAYQAFIKAKNYRGSDFPDIDRLIDDAAYFGISRVLVDVDNRTQQNLPPEFYEQLLAVNTSNLNSKWVEYHLGRKDNSIEFDYNVSISIVGIEVSPERYNSKEYMRKKTIPDGYDYVLDARGNVMKDSLGNDIKLERFRDLTCTLIERQQLKEAHVNAEIEIMSLNPKVLKKKIPAAGSSIFEHYSGRAVGEIEALSREDLQVLESEPLPFPDDIQMIFDCIPPLQAAISDALRANKNIIH